MMLNYLCVGFFRLFFLSHDGRLSMRVRSGGCVGHINSKQTHEDCVAIDPNGSFFILSAGMGANESGALASRKVCEAIVRTLVPKREQMDALASDIHPDARKMLMSVLCDALRQAEREIFKLVESNPLYKGLAATCDLVYLSNGTAYIAHIGDSRVYLLRGDTGRQLTVDHNMYEFLRAQGKRDDEIVYNPYRERIIRALGMSINADIDTLQFDLRQGDRIVLCSSGLHRYLQNATHLAQLYRTVEPQRAAEFLTNFAYEHNGTTCVSNICIEISEPGRRHASIETDSKITALEQICFFRDLSYQEMLQVMPITFERSYEQGKVIIHEGDEGDELFILVEGTCEVTNSGVKLAKLEAGSSFGELSLVDRQPRSATVKALKPSRVLIIRATDFEKLTISGSLAVKLLWNVVHELSERLRRSSDTIRAQGVQLLELSETLERLRHKSF